MGEEVHDSLIARVPFEVGFHGPETMTAGSILLVLMATGANPVGPLVARVHPAAHSPQYLLREPPRVGFALVRAFALGGSAF